MRSVADIIGKRLKSDKEITLYARFPESDTVFTLPPGAVSPKITSYLPSGFFQLQGTGRFGEEVEDANWYAKDTEDIQLVPGDTESDASIFDWVGYRVSDFWNNYTRENSKIAKRYKEAFNESIENVKLDGFTLAKQARYILLLIVAVLLITTIRDILR